MSDSIFFILIGYLSGSTLYARILPKHFCGIDVCEVGEDKNPGVYNAFSCAGIKIGIPVLLLELAKGFLPVFFAMRMLHPNAPLFCLILAAPVIGHAFPLFQVKHGGKAIAVSFGCLLGLYPVLDPLFCLVFFYLLFSVVVVLEPHLFRSVVTFTCFALACARTVPIPSVIYGTLLISATVVLKHCARYKKEPLRVHFLLWNR